jgi:hypothetical protein
VAKKRKVDKLAGKGSFLEKLMIRRKKLEGTYKPRKNPLHGLKMSGR